MPIVQAEDLTKITAAILQAAGAPADYADMVADHLVDANLAGHDSHGVLRAPHYVRQIDNAQLVPQAQPEIVEETAAMAQIDGHWTFGQVIARFGAELAIEKARAEGIALVAMYHEGHTGRIGAYAETAARAGMASMMWDGCIGGPKAIVVPLNGAGRKIGANPIAMGLPGQRYGPVILDFASSMSAAGKVMFAQAKGEALPSEWIVDAQGHPTDDPNQLQAGGALRPMGLPSVGHKGYALAMMVGLFGLMASMRSDIELLDDSRWGTVLLVIDISRFGPLDLFRGQVDQVIEYVKADPLEGEVLYPGEIEARQRQSRLADGIELPEPTWQELLGCVHRFGLEEELAAYLDEAQG